MKPFFLLMALTAALRAQAPPAPAAPVRTTPAAAAPAAPAPPDAAASPEQNFSGSIDVGYRWVGVGGSVNTYRSIVDLGSGPKLLGAEFTILDPGKRLFDRIDVSAFNWGDDPYSTLHVDVRKAKLYEFSGGYRNIAYYNNLPAFADPLLATNGVTLNEQALDTRQRTGTYHLGILPGRMIVPFIEYERNAENGTGIATFVANANEYPVASLIRNATDNYRAGARVELSRFHAKVEEGGTTFKDDQQLNAHGYTNNGNFFAPILGQKLYLTSLSEAYGVRGHSTYTDASFSANPVAWADLFGSFLYSEPVSNVNFQAASSGSQILFTQILRYTGEQDLIASLSKQPHTSANLGAELRPLQRLRVVPSWLTDRMHTSGSGFLQQNLSTAAGPVALPSLLTSGLVVNSSQAGINVFFDLTGKLTLRGGYRREWGNASDVILPVAGLAGFEQGKIRRNVAIAAVSWHPVANGWFNVEFEDGSSGSTYFRTSLYNYQKAKLRGRYRLSPSFSISANASVLSNRNPTPGISFSFLTHQESASLVYSPASGKLWDFEGGYTRSTLRSSIAYINPEFFNLENSFYRDNSHTVSALLNLNLPGAPAHKARVTLGGSAFLSSGSNPTTFYQPVAKLTVPVGRSVSWVSEWRYYGFDESFYLFQGFRTQMVTTGLRIAR